jgi:hypothetical protein
MSSPIHKTSSQGRRPLALSDRIALLFLRAVTFAHHDRLAVIDVDATVQPIGFDKEDWYSGDGVPRS